MMHLSDAIFAPAPPRPLARRPLRLAVLLSAATHAVVLWLAAAPVVTGLPSVELIRIAVRPGGGASTGAAVIPAPPAPVAVAPPGQPQVPAQTQSAVASAPKPAPARPRPVPRSAAPPRAASATDAPAAPPDALVVPSADTSGAAVAAVGPAPGSSAGAGGGGRGSGDSRGAGSDVGDQRAACVFCPEPVYPLIARRRGWHGTVDVGLVLLADGRVDSASVRRSSGFDVLDREALAVARRSRFRLPDLGRPAVVGQIKYRFELVGTD